jgi:hypothetical protein
MRRDGWLMSSSPLTTLPQVYGCLGTIASTNRSQNAQDVDDGRTTSNALRRVTRIHAYTRVHLVGKYSTLTHTVMVVFLSI